MHTGNPLVAAVAEDHFMGKVVMTSYCDAAIRKGLGRLGQEGFERHNRLNHAGL
jgi:hypothetical protein